MQILSTFLLLCLALFAGPARADGEYVSLDASYTPNLLFTAEGSSKKFGFSGGRADLDLHLPFFTRQDGFLVSWGLYGTVGAYKNSHTLGEAKETLKAQGGGLSVNFCTKQIPNLHLFGSAGYAAMALEQSGEARRSQKFGGLDFRIGLGVGPMVGASGIYVRVNAQIYAATGKENGSEQELRAIQGAGGNFQLGYAFAF